MNSYVILQELLVEWTRRPQTRGFHFSRMLRTMTLLDTELGEGPFHWDVSLPVVPGATNGHPVGQPAQK